MLFSVVMAVYNGEEYLKEAIDSILHQTYTDFEFIIVNDGSSDKTREILNLIEDNRVRVIHLEENKGLANALNIGIQNANGEWIIRQDADDMSYPHRIMEQANHIKSHPDVILLGSHIKCFSGRTSVSKKILKIVEKYFNGFVNRADLRRGRFIGCPLSHGTCTFLKEAFFRAGQYDPKYTIVQDYDLWLRMFELGEVDIVPQVLYKYQIRMDSLSNNNQLNLGNQLNVTSIKYIREQCFRDHKKKPVFLVMGPHKARGNFIKNIYPNVEIKLYDYVYKKLVDYCDEAYQLFLEGKIQGIIVMGHRGDDKIVDLLQTKGMEFNQNLFKLTNFIV
ncbi:glycosyltransferase [Bacillus sp. ISL-46]|uniref:glycosyltransferase family 2 protein n=1 Tax=Bacillus sp. ISL-46 TaxID=2819129 RepID=UPI001BE6E539|nr:glycosyltransferase [Bacillus sp. ISL-46]MBT2724651.1 glycosyltransferase [Bacillus sp. ISL-46]